MKSRDFFTIYESRFYCQEMYFMTEILLHISTLFFWDCHKLEAFFVWLVNLMKKSSMWCSNKYSRQSLIRIGSIVIINPLSIYIIPSTDDDDIDDGSEWEKAEKNKFISASSAIIPSLKRRSSFLLFLYAIKTTLNEEIFSILLCHKFHPNWI